MLKLIFRNGLEILCSLTLKGESVFWLFTRSSDQKFDKYTSVIKVSKEDKCQRCFVSMGTFVEVNGDKGKDDKIIFKTFSKRQMINFSKSKTNFYYENDICEIKMSILDSGYENIIAKIFGKFIY